MSAHLFSKKSSVQLTKLHTHTRWLLLHLLHSAYALKMQSLIHSQRLMKHQKPSRLLPASKARAVFHYCTGFAAAAAVQEATDRCMLHLLFMLMRLLFYVLQQNCMSQLHCMFWMPPMPLQSAVVAKKCSFDLTVLCSSTRMLCCLCCNVGLSFCSVDLKNTQFCSVTTSALHMLA